MTLHAVVELPVAFEPRRIHDRSADRLDFRFARAGGLDMGAARSMAPLAIYAFGNGAFSNGVRWVAVMTEQAIVGRRPAEVFLPRVVISGTHCPVAAIFAIPTDRQFD